MNREDVIRMARDAGGVFIDPPCGDCYTFDIDNGELERFFQAAYAAGAAAEREACAELVWPTQQVKTWSDEEMTAMTSAFNRAQEKHGWYETIMAVGAAALKGRADAIRARGQV